VVLATGVAYTRLRAPGVDDFAGRGVYYGAAAHEAVNCKQQPVYIVGGANSAGQAALYFAKFASQVTMLIRGKDIRAGMSEYLVTRIEQHEKIEVLTCTEIVGGTGNEHLEQLSLRSNVDERTWTVDTSWVFVFIGAVPHTDWLGQDYVRDKYGFVLTGPELLDEQGRPPAGWPRDRGPFELESSVPGVFVAGDVRAASVKRVASAVGEGAMAVTLVHRYLGPQT
jgi:thioredoxin reductase (NADPH)